MAIERGVLLPNMVVQVVYDESGCGFTGMVGTLVDINEHNEDGDFYGVKFPDEKNVIYFWRHELSLV